MTGGRIALLVVGSILALFSLGLLVGGGTLVWAHTTQRDDDGYYTTRFERFQSDGYAIRSDDLDLSTDGPDWLFDEGRLGRVRLSGESQTSGKELFLGIGPKREVEEYLNGVDHDVLVDFEVDPFRAEYRDEPGARMPEMPGSQPFWAAVGERRLEWDVAEGNWVAVAMNADASRGVIADVSAGAKTGLVLWAALIVLGLGVLFGGVAALLIVLGLRGRHVPPAPAPEASPGAAGGGGPG